MDPNLKSGDDVAGANAHGIGPDTNPAPSADEIAAAEAAAAAAAAEAAAVAEAARQKAEQEAAAEAARQAAVDEAARKAAEAAAADETARKAAEAHRANAIAEAAKRQNTGSGETPKPAAAPAAERLSYVIDTTATAESGARVHDQVIDGAVRSFRFEHGKPLGMEPHIAVKFLKHDGFKLTDVNGNLLNYRRRPTQPDELGAGEKFKLGEDETVARYEELSEASLFRRVSELPGGEKFARAEKLDRKGVIEFIKAHVASMKKVNTKADNGPDDWVPEAIDDEDAA